MHAIAEGAHLIGLETHHQAVARDRPDSKKIIAFRATRGLTWLEPARLLSDKIINHRLDGARSPVGQRSQVVVQREQLP